MPEWTGPTFAQVECWLEKPVSGKPLIFERVVPEMEIELDSVAVLSRIDRSGDEPESDRERPYHIPHRRPAGYLFTDVWGWGFKIHTSSSPLGGGAKIINTHDRKKRFIEYSGETESRSWNTIGLFLVGSLVRSFLVRFVRQMRIII